MMFFSKAKNSKNSLLKAAAIDMKPRLKPSVFLLFSSIILSVVALCAFVLWNSINQHQLAKLAQSAKQNLTLYGSKIERELGQVQQSLLPLIASHPALLNYLLPYELPLSKLLPSKLSPSGTLLPTAQFQAQTQLTRLHTVLSNRTVFIGNAKQLLIASSNKKLDLVLLEGIKKTIVSRIYKDKPYRQFVFPIDGRSAKFLIALPIKKNGAVLGFIGMLMELSFVQQQLASSLLPDQEILMVSDERGIILLSSNAQWLYKSFSNLPYSLKKIINAQFEQKQLFSQLGIVNIDNGILKTANAAQEQTYLVHSILLKGYPLRLHHLANIDDIKKQSYLYVLFFLFCIILLALMVLFLKTKRRAQAEKINLEQTLLERDTEFKHQQKLASLGMVATTIAHEINQPITAIKTEASIGCKYNERGDTGQVQHSLKIILEYTRLLASITAQLKDFARKRKTKKSNTANIEQTIKQSLTLNHSRMKADGVDYFVNDFDGSISAKIDEHQLQQVLSNLLQNSCDAMQTCQVKHIDISVTAEQECIYIKVSDSGIGIDKAMQKTVFDAFVSSKNETSSMGLGLAICQDILSHFGGGIRIITDENVSLSEPAGATFMISLLAETKAQVQP
ncbi:MAG: GHKL domain-containing protein [Alcanivoracaceae bacterium]|nr:GHKL domain-containing protein [Alcanivoracaceae bacterium]